MAVPTNGLSFEDDIDCQPENEWCNYREPHRHGGFACDPTCPCYDLSGLARPKGR